MHPTNPSRDSIHQQILFHINDLLENLGVEEKTARINDIIAQAKKIIRPQKDILETQIVALEKHANWDRFVVAFYGETNAGKSTIIETLRIFLKEPSKVEAHRKLRSELSDIREETEIILAIAQKIEDCETQAAALNNQHDEMAAQHAIQAQTEEQELMRLRELLANRKKSLSFWRKLLSLFRKLPEQIAVKRCLRQTAMLDASRNTERSDLEAQIEGVKSQGEHLQKILDSKTAALQEKMQTIAPMTDGTIIGTGISDFTRDIQAYAFSLGGHDVTLLDVPGIEGGEQQVMDSISVALKQAHAVFYVTSKAAVPQTGDEHTEGTLEKIRKHLGDQTEVWSIYNKRISSPRSLLEGSLLNDGEIRSLADMDNTLRENLGEDHYQGHFSVSAQPAFFAVAKFVLPESPLARNRAKFLERADSEVWWEKSGFERFTQWLERHMVANSQIRIRNANIHKITHAILTTVEKIKKFQSDVVQPHAQQIKEEGRSVEKRLEIATKTFDTALTNAGSDAIDQYISRVKNDMYTHIARDIKNDAVKSLLQETIAQEQDVLQKDLLVVMDAQVRVFQKNIESILAQFKEHAAEIGETFRSVSHVEFGKSFNFEMNFNNGIDYTGLLASLMGTGGLVYGMLNAWNPSGWVALALGAAGVLVGLFKSVAGFFSSDYKKSQQRKVVEENLRKLRKSLEISMQEKCTESTEVAKASVATITAQIRESVKTIEHVNTLLIQTNGSLATLAKQLSS